MKKILIVDDEKDFVNLMKGFLEKRGYAVTSAYDGIGALEKTKESPDMVLLDIKMPNMDGFEVLRRLRSNPDTANTHIIMLTAMTETASIFESQRFRATDHIVKPTNLEDLLKVIRKYLDDDMGRSAATLKRRF
jgi:CheY-like chemotaxis protein